MAEIVARQSGNIIKLEHNQFVSINRLSKVELRVTLEAFGHEHKAAILEALRKEGYDARAVDSPECIRLTHKKRNGRRNSIRSVSI